MNETPLRGRGGRCGVREHLRARTVARQLSRCSAWKDPCGIPGSLSDPSIGAEQTQLSPGAVRDRAL